MADLPENADQDFPPVQVRQRSLWQRLPLVWLIPLVALLAGGWLAIKALREQGPTVTISFQSAEGLEPGKTKLKFKELDIGLVKKVSLSDDRSHVLVTAEMTRAAADMMVEDTRFWVVRPRVANGGISGLETLVSGAYIGVDVGSSAKGRESFTGLEVPPILTAHREGRLFRLRARDLGSLSYGTPVYFRRIEVGELVAYQLDRDGSGITAQIFIHAPYDQYVTADTRFWHASGLDISVDAAGVKMRTQSLSSVLLGGIAFGNGGKPLAQVAPDNASFLLADSRDEAFKPDESVIDEFEIVFSESVRGLKPGAEVNFRGVAVGEVVSIDMRYDRKRRSLNVPVLIQLYPERMRSLWPEGGGGPEAVQARRRVFGEFVESGLRAQLRTGSLLTGQLYVALEFFPKLPRQSVDWARVPPLLPATHGDLQALQDTLASIAAKLDRVPFEQIGADLHKALQSLDKTLKDADALVGRLDGEIAPELKATLVAARQTFASVEQTLANPSPLQQELQGSLREVSRAAQSVREVMDYLDRHPEALLRGKVEEKAP
jgi:paraquat-inducible protein B